MIGRVLALAVGLLAGLAGSQAPEYAQQYRQRLGGAIDELRRVVSMMDDNARAENLSRNAFIDRFRQSPDPVVRRDGEDKARIADRLARLEQQRQSFVEAGPFARLLVLLRDPDPDLARGAYLDYEPAWPATGEGLAAGGAGFALGWGLLLFLSRIVSRLTPRRRSRRGGLRSA